MSDGYAALCLREEYEIARDKLDRGTELLNRIADARERLSWGVLDLDEARQLVHQVKRACRAHRGCH